MLNGMVRDVRKQVDSSWVELLETVRSERVALVEAVGKEREATMNDVDAQRQAFAADAARISSQVISETATEVRRLVREACDGLYALPAPGQIKSLNISNAAAIVFYEAAKSAGEAQ